MKALSALLVLATLSFPVQADPSPQQPGFRPARAVVRREMLLEHVPAAKIIAFLQSQYRNVQFIPHPTLNGFYAVGSKREVLQIQAELPDLDKVPAPPALPTREFYQVKYGNLEEVRSLLHTMVPDVEISVAETTSTLILEGVPGAIEQAKDLLDQIDQPLDQIMLGVKFIAATPATDKHLEIEWDSTPPESTQFYDFAGVREGGYAFTGFPLTGLLEVVPRIGHLRSQQLDRNINFLITSSDAGVLAAPRVALQSGTEAQVHIGDQYPIVGYSPQKGQFEVAYSPIDFKIDLLPEQRPDGTIDCTVRAESTLPTRIVQNRLVLSQHTVVTTKINLKDGETCALEGLCTNDQLRQAPPALADAPIIGKLFRDFTIGSPNSRPLLFITAHLMK